MLRIRKIRWKVAFIGAGVILILLLNSVVIPRILPEPVDVIVGSSLPLVLYLFGARVFRGRGEPISPPRAWWRMTSQPTAGFVIGALLCASVANSILFAFAGPELGLLASTLSAAEDALVAGLYFHSSLRLRRNPPATVPEPEAPPKWRPIRD